MALLTNPYSKFGDIILLQMGTLSWEAAQHLKVLPYFLGYKTDFFSFQNNPKDLDPSYKMDLDL